MRHTGFVSAIDRLPPWLLALMLMALMQLAGMVRAQHYLTLEIEGDDDLQLVALWVIVPHAEAWRHSTDLRERIINAVIHKRYTLQKAADTFDVGAATVSRYLRRYRQTGDLTPRTSPGRPSALNEYQAWVEQSLISNDLTHDQRCDLLFDEIGVRISRATRCRWVQRLGSTRKKDDLRQ